MQGWKGVLSTIVQEVRWQFCQSSPSSEGMRAFVKQNYSSVKKLNPKLPILVRECSGIQPRIVARYDFGEEKAIYVTDMTPDQIGKQMEVLIAHGNIMRRAD